MTTQTTMPYSIKEEIWSSLIHGIGILFAITALSLLVTFSAINGNVWGVVASAIFGTSMIVLYTASTIYHAVTNPETKKKLKKFDHIAIYYLIAGTYTPFILVNMRTTLGWTVFGIVWGLAFLGTILKLCLQPGGTKAWSISLYLGMGWMILFASKTLFAIMSTAGIVFLLLGGLFYTVGVIFYMQKTKPYTHAIWHFFVLNGTIMHFFSVLYGCVLTN